MINLPKDVLKLCNYLHENKIEAIVVGGYVRDALLHVDSKDIDIELYGVENLAALKEMLTPHYKVNEAGKSFGVLKVVIDGYDIDLSLPRTEQKSGNRHTDFTITTHKTIEFKEASKRRDFTCNAIGYEVSTRRILDPYSGIADLKKGRLEYVNADTFIEDPLRLFRAIQFCARFDLKPSDALKALLQKMYKEKLLLHLPKERIFEEIKKLLLKSERPSIGFNLMKRLDMLEVFPEIDSLVGVQQDSHYHGEGDVFIHTMMVLDEMAKRISGVEDEKKRLIFMLAALCHDFGKPATTKVVDGKIRAIAHEIAGIAPTRAFIERLSDDKKLNDEVSNLVKHHLKVMQFYNNSAGDGAIRRLACEINIEDLTLLAEADYFGRISKEREPVFTAGIWLKERAEILHVKDAKPKALIQGRDLIALGLQPSKAFGDILAKVYEAQLDGVVERYEEALAYTKKLI